MYMSIFILIMLGTPQARSWNKKKLPPVDISVEEGKSSFGVGFIAIPERGLLLERTGTLISHADYNIASVLIKLPKLPLPDISAQCNATIVDIWMDYGDALDKLKHIADTIFLAESQLTSDDICNTFQLKNCNTISKKHKRFIASVAAAATAASALAVAEQNRAQIQKIKKHLSQVDEEVTSIKQELVNQKYKIEVLTDATKTLFGFVHEFERKVDIMTAQINCLLYASQYRHLAYKSLDKVKNAIQFILNGQTTGRLTPSFLEPDELKQIVTGHIGKASSFYQNHPHILYQTATVTLVDVDIETLIMRYLILYPNLDTASLSPFYRVHQVGFLANDQQHNTSICLRFVTPKFAIITNDTWYMLDTPRQCPIFGKVMLCQQSNFELHKFSECLRISNVSAIQCPLASVQVLIISQHPQE